MRRGGDRQQFTTLPAVSDPSLSSAAPSWARVVRDGASVTSQPPHPQSTLSPKEDFLRLYGLCVANGFTARVAIHSAAGNQEITLSCRLRVPSTSMTAQVARRRRQRRRRRQNTNMGDVANHLTAATPALIAPWSPSLAARTIRARALATHAPTARTLASMLFADSLSTACKTDEEGGEKTMRG